MRECFLALLFALSLSCNHVGAYKAGKMEKANATPAKGFVCNYPEYKTITKQLFEAYKNAPDSLKKHRLLNNLRDSLFVCWLGTPWDFNGTTEEPNNGKIACGYFVTTFLRDIGAKVNRIKHAQCASEEMIKAVCIKTSIAHHSNQDISTFVQRINEAGLYIVGLDFHTGFILNDGNEIYFIHANYTGNKVVEKEIAVKSVVLATSKYKVIGKVI